MWIDESIRYRDWFELKKEGNIWIENVPNFNIFVPNFNIFNVFEHDKIHWNLQWVLCEWLMSNVINIYMFQISTFELYKVMNIWVNLLEIFKLKGRHFMMKFSTNNEESNQGSASKLDHGCCCSSNCACSFEMISISGCYLWMS